MNVFVFGSNREGRHGAGAAKFALDHFGAIYGQAVGRQGNSYAIVTKELRKNMPPVDLNEIRTQVLLFCEYAAGKPEDLFEVTRIGCGLAGFTDDQIAPMFEGASGNVLLPSGWGAVSYDAAVARRNAIDALNRLTPKQLAELEAWLDTLPDRD